MVGEERVSRSRGAARTGRRKGARVPSLRVTLLDTFSVSENGVPRRLPRAGQRLVALVALHRRGLTRRSAAALLSPHLEQASAFTSLRGALSRTRAACPSLVEADTTHVRLNPSAAVDLWEIEERAALLALPPELRGGRVAAPIEQAGELLPAWDEDWVGVERERFRELLLHGIEAQARAFMSEGNAVAAFASAYEVLRIDPLRESATRIVIELHVSEGNVAQALRCYLDFRERMHDMLGVEPSEAMRALITPLQSRVRDR